MPKPIPYNADRTAKTCSQCDLMKPLSDYHKQGDGKSGLRAYCKSCSAKYRRAWIEREGKRERTRRPISREQRRIEAARWRARHLEHYRAYQRAYHRVWDKANRARKAAQAPQA